MASSLVLSVLSRIEYRDKGKKERSVFTGSVDGVKDGRISVNLSSGDRVSVPLSGSVANSSLRSGTVLVVRPKNGDSFLLKEIR